MHACLTGPRNAFTLVEVLVATTVLVILIALLGQMLNGTASLVSARNQSADVDAKARALLDRVGIDIDQMVKRTDVNYFLKSTTTETSNQQINDVNTGGDNSNAMAGDDQIAFYSQVPGYYSSSTAPSQSTLSVVGYRLNVTAAPTYSMQRFGRGLFWNGATATTSAGSSSQGDQPVFLPLTLGSGARGQWPNVASRTAADPDYESIGPPVFRFEYCYLLKSGVLSATPWDAAASHHSLNGMQDVAAIVVTIAAINPASRQRVSDTQLGLLAGSLKDFNSAAMTTPDALVASWRAVLNNAAGSPANLSVSALSALHIYQRYYYLSHR